MSSYSILPRNSPIPWMCTGLASLLAGSCLTTCLAAWVVNSTEFSAEFDANMSLWMREIGKQPHHSRTVWAKPYFLSLTTSSSLRSSGVPASSLSIPTHWGISAMGIFKCQPSQQYVSVLTLGIDLWKKKGTKYVINVMQKTILSAKKVLIRCWKQIFTDLWTLTI